MGDASSIWTELAQSWLAIAIKEATWAYPILETIHLLGLGLLIGPIILVDLAMLGWRRQIALDAVQGLLLPAVYAGLVLNVASGALLFLSDAAEFAANPAFQVKMGLIVVGIVNGALFRVRHGRRAVVREEIGAGAKLQAVASIVIWSLVVVAGRMIAYVA